MNTLRQVNTPETHTPINLASETYRHLVTEVDAGLAPHHDITYIPLKADQQPTEAKNIHYGTPDELEAKLAHTDAIICISRDEDLNPDYTDQYPDRNITLTPSGEANIDKAVELFHLARAQGNEDVTFVATGRMHNRAIRMMLALPVIAEAIGINAEDAYHTPQERFRQLLDEEFRPEALDNLQLDMHDPQVAASRQAVDAILASASEDQTPADAIWREYQRYPRITTSRLMLERAVERGIPLESIVEEDGAVDTISNMLNVAHMIAAGDPVAHKTITDVTIVAGSDHLPRTTWIADHILPGGITITSVEADPALSQEAYDASCVREAGSFRKGCLSWISGTRDIHELDKLVEAGYFGVDRKESHELAHNIATDMAARITTPKT